MSAKVRWSYQLPTYVVLICLFDGMGCLRVSAARLGLTALGYISCEIAKAAKRVVLLKWPGVIEWDNVESVYRDVVDSIMKSFAGHTGDLRLPFSRGKARLLCRSPLGLHCFLDKLD